MFFLHKKKDLYQNYSKDLKEWCENRDNYLSYWNKSGEYIEKINEYYSLFINNNFDEKYFKLLQEYCYKYIELQPILNKAILEENRINKTNNPVPKQCIGYKKLIQAYEKLKDYTNAIKLCEEALSKGYTDDNTKGGYAKRLENLKIKTKED